MLTHRRMTPPIAGMTVVRCNANVREIVARLEDVVRARGMTVFARIDYMADAAAAGLALLPTTLVLFGDPHVGTRLLQVAQTAGFDLPLKALVWTDALGETWLGHTEVSWLAERHGVALDAVVGGMASALARIATEVTTAAGDHFAGSVRTGGAA
jgi:uncharacterized protein (DUF302 family)